VIIILDGLTLALTGQGVNLTTGSLSPLSALQLTGLAAAVNTSGVMPGSQKAIAGNHTDFYAGSLNFGTERLLSSLSLTLTNGVLVVYDANVTVSLTGQSLGAIRGALIPVHTSGLAGAGLAVNLTALLPDINQQLQGQGLLAHTGVYKIGIELLIAGQQVTLELSTLRIASGAHSVEWVLVEHNPYLLIAESSYNTVLCDQPQKTTVVIH
jgi:hypothetical protein